jgi:seryl-tRNA synthetase
MLDLNLIRERPEEVRNALLKRMESVDFGEVLSWDGERRSIIHEAEALKAKRNTVSSDIPRLKKAGEPVDALLEEMKRVSSRIKELDARLDEISRKIHDFLASLPNIPADDVPAGGKEQNRIERVWGEAPAFDFPVADHVTLVERLGLIDYERGVKMGGNGFWLYRGYGARIEWALLNLFVEEHLADGYEFMLPPHLLVEACGYTAGQFPKFADDVFHLAGEDSDHFLLPTAETALINVHRDEIVDESALPLKYFSYTPCYRREAGSYRAKERGMIRGHQFNKVEMFQYTRPEESGVAFDELVEKAERLVRKLGLHHRVTRLAAGDCSASMAKTFDIEVWIPSMEMFMEVSSISNAHTYQARRGNIRFRREATGKPEFLHTLNASGLATSRIFPALIEHGQQADGSVVLPEVLARQLGTEVLTPPGAK